MTGKPFKIYVEKVEKERRVLEVPSPERRRQIIRYDHPEHQPPAPVADLEVSNPATHVAEKGRAKIDAGADISVIPEAWAARAAGVVQAPVYYVNISINNPPASLNPGLAEADP